MGMDAQQLNPWKAHAITLGNDPARKIFLFAQDVLLDMKEGKIVNTNNLLFTLLHLWQSGHMVAVMCKPSHHPKRNVEMVRAMADAIKAHIGVPLWVITALCEEDDQLKDQGAFENTQAMHPNVRDHNADIMFSLAELGIYCKPNELQHDRIINPNTVLPDELHALHTHRTAISSTQVVLVSDDRTAIAQAKAIGYRATLAPSFANIRNPRVTKQPNLHFQQLLATHTALATQSMAWLQHHKHPRQAHEPNHGMDWLHYQYYLSHFHHDADARILRKIQQRAWEDYTPSSPIRSWIKNSKKGFAVVMVGGVSVACIGTGFAMISMGKMFSMAAASVFAKAILAKASLSFGVGAASGSVMLSFGKILSMKKQQGKKRAFYKWLRSQRLINDMLRQTEKDRNLMIHLAQRSTNAKTLPMDYSATAITSELTEARPVMR